MTLEGALRLKSLTQVESYDMNVVVDSLGNVLKAPPVEDQGIPWHNLGFIDYDQTIYIPMQSYGIQNAPGAYHVKVMLLLFANHYRTVGTAREHYAVSARMTCHFAVLVDTTPGNNHNVSGIKVIGYDGQWLRYNRTGTVGSSVIDSGALNTKDVQPKLSIHNTYARMGITNLCCQHTELPTNENAPAGNETLRIGGKFALEWAHQNTTITTY